MSIPLDLFVFPFHSQLCFSMYCMLPLVLVVVIDPFIIGPLSWISPSCSIQIILPIILPWLILRHLSLCCILHTLDRFLGALLALVCWILVLGKNIHLLCFVPMVLRCRIHPNVCGESFWFFCICCWNWMWCSAILKWIDPLCGLYFWVCLYRHSWVRCH